VHGSTDARNWQILFAFYMASTTQHCDFLMLSCERKSKYARRHFVQIFSKPSTRYLRTCALAIALALAGCGGSDSDSGLGSGTPVVSPKVGVNVANPTVMGPIPVVTPPGSASHDYPQLATQANLASNGYVEEEYFFSGNATRYNTPDLQTGTAISAANPYKSRMIVRRPTNPAKFNGVVIVEWVNVTSGYNYDLLWQASSDHFMREGYAYVGVSAQRVGVHQEATGLKSWGPKRYASLDVTANGAITDDSLSYDIFAQGARAIQNPQGVNPLGNLSTPRLVIGSGVSQSQGRLVTYYNSVQPLHNLFDSFYLYLGVGGRLRTDLNVKVFKIDTENDVLLLGEGAARQPDSDRLRTWEIAGGSHVNFHDMVVRVPLVTRDALPIPNTNCDLPALSRVPAAHVLNAAYGHLVNWTTAGTLPPTAERIQLATVGTPPAPSTAVRDGYGNALGGIRLAEHAVATATNTGVNSGSAFCRLYGSHQPFTATQLSTLYLNHNAYVSAVTTVTNNNLTAGYILPTEAATTIQDADQSTIGK
jgi:hypothetical protein